MTMKLANLARLALSWLFCLALTVNAVPIADNTKRDVIDPPVTSPDADTVWVIGTKQTVTWDTSVFEGQNLSTTKGQIFLGFLNDTSGNEHLNTTNPLATGFDIRTGSINITVPKVTPGNDYIIALLGDSGNISPTFTITNSSNDSGPVTTTMTLTSTTTPASSTSSSSSSSSTNGTSSSRVFVSSSDSQAGGSTATKTAGTSATSTNTAIAQSSLSNALARPAANTGSLVVVLVAIFALL